MLSTSSVLAPVRATTFVMQIICYNADSSQCYCMLLFLLSFCAIHHITLYYYCSSCSIWGGHSSYSCSTLHQTRAATIGVYCVKRTLWIVWLWYSHHYSATGIATSSIINTDTADMFVVLLCIRQYRGAAVDCNRNHCRLHRSKCQQWPAVLSIQCCRRACC
jgi:hypothetical protein